MYQCFDVVVIGGGVIGTTCAWRLAQTGRNVLLLEGGDRCGAQASSAAAGILGAQLEVSEPGPFYDLCIESRAIYQTFVDELFAVTGIDVELTQNGLLQIAYTEKEASALRDKMKWQQQAGSRAQWLEQGDVLNQEKSLAPVWGALYLPDDGNILAPTLMRALEVAVKKTCVVKEGTEVFEIQSDTDRTFRLLTSTGTVSAESVVVAAGAWANRLLGSFGAVSAIRPVKGQLLAVRPRRGSGLSHTVYHNHTYLVPKRDGRIVIGATEDFEAGFNRDVTCGSIATLLTTAQRIVPGLGDFSFEGSWTGIRPGSRDKKPWVGQVPGSKGLYSAVGHYRNGILLAPITANMVVSSIEGTQWPLHWQAFHAGRANSDGS